MSAVKRIKQASLKILGCEAEPWDDVWKRVKELSKAFGDSEVGAAFEEWASVHQGEIINRPVAEFLKTAPGQLQGTFKIKMDNDLKDFINELSFSTDNEITFDREQQFAIGKLVSTCSKEEIKKALKEYHQSLEGDTFLLKNAAAKFVDKAEQFVYAQRQRKKAAAQQEELLKQALADEQAKAAKELEIARQKEAEENDLDGEL